MKSIPVLLFVILVASSTTASEVDQIKIQPLLTYNITQNNYNSDIVVAVIDTGIDLSHPAYEGKLWTNPLEIANNSIDDDNNGYIDDIHGYNFVSDTNDIQDDNPISHGTHTAGLIAGDQVGVSQTATKLMILKAFDDSGNADFDTVAEAIYYAVDNGAHIISMSLGGESTSSSLNTAIDYAKQHAVLMVAASGNAGRSVVDYPARLDGVIAVGSVNQFNQRSSFSNYGSNLDVMAPGENINSSVREGRGWSSVISVNGSTIRSYPMQYSDYTHGSLELQVIDGGSGSIDELDQVNMTTPLENKAVLIERGQLDFATMAKNLRSFHASALIVFNNEDGMFGGDLLANYSIPAVSINHKDGVLLKSLANTSTIQLSVATSDYFINTGTSMATPQVAGVLAELLHTGLGYDMIEHYLQFGSYKPGGWTRQRSTTMGYGIVNGSMLVDLLTDTTAPVIVEGSENFTIYDEQVIFRLNISDNIALDTVEVTSTYSNNQSDPYYLQSQTFLPDSKSHRLNIGLDRTQNQEQMYISVNATDASGNSVVQTFDLQLIRDLVLVSNSSSSPWSSMTLLSPILILIRRRKLSC